MSYDFALEMGGIEVFCYDLNYTWNVAPMYQIAFNCKEGINCLNEKKCNKIKPIITKTIEDMKQNKQKYVKLNPENGWGDYEGALNVLEELKKWCEECPTATLMIY